MVILYIILFVLIVFTYIKFPPIGIDVRRWNYIIARAILTKYENLRYSEKKMIIAHANRIVTDIYKGDYKSSAKYMRRLIVIAKIINKRDIEKEKEIRELIKSIENIIKP